MTKTDTGVLAVLTLDLHGEAFAIEATLVREILDLVPVTRVPGADPFLDGLVNVRGRIVPLADLGLKFGLRPRADGIDTRIVVVEIDLDGDATVVAIRADKVHEVSEISFSRLADVPRIGLRWPAEYVRAIGKRDADFVMVLDLPRIFAEGGPADAAAKLDFRPAA